MQSPLRRHKREECPPCFDCHLKAFPCLNTGNCSDATGKCDCVSGFGGNDCGLPLCGSPVLQKRPFPGPDGRCQCDEGWTGPNCNICTRNSVCDPIVLPNQNATCYNGLEPVKENNVHCQVTNEAIKKLLKERIPELSLSCSKETQKCHFEFWVSGIQSFYCGLDECQFETKIGSQSNTTRTVCNKVRCGCYPGRLLCGEGGSVDITEWFESEEGPKGPGAFECSQVFGDRSCTFKEDNMNSFISDFFGDNFIKLECPTAGECMHYTQVPGHSPPSFDSGFSPLVIALMVVGGLGIVLIMGLGLLWYKRKTEAGEDGYIPIETSDEAYLQRRETMMQNHEPSTIMFQNLSYVVETTQGAQVGQAGSGKKKMAVLEDVQGIVRPGQVMAIMGGSGAGKTTFLDILARKNKSGVASGDVLVNGKFMDYNDYRNIIGYVDQEDTLMDTLTVYETILYSALLRLPEKMSLEEKKQRVQDTMIELDILQIANRRIGSSGKRGLSGGEKRRVSIACELVTSPSILFLDEPTSGLDSFNAYNVIECLVGLAREFQRTVIFTIHQPRSNIYALFDQLVLLSKGRAVYSGPAQEYVLQHFSSLGYECPMGFNLADYLVDLTMHASKSDDADSEDEIAMGQMADSMISTTSSNRGHRLNIREEQEGKLYSPKSPKITQFQMTEPGSSTRRSPTKKSLSQLISDDDIVRLPLTDESKRLINGYKHSAVGQSIKREIESSLNIHYPGESQERLRRARQMASWWTQFTILSSRTFKNLIRNPDLLKTHYLISVFVAVLCGLLFWNVDNSLAGFQNRLGVMFFICAVFGFGCLSSMQAFASERLIFVRERANRYYSPVTYFLSKILCDIVPLRVVPPIILGLISYNMIGLKPDIGALLRLLLVLVLFNLSAASICLAISIIFKDTGVANLVATLVMLFEMLFGGLLLNKASIPAAFQWLDRLSFFNYAFEALVVNEVATLVLVEEKYGLKIDVPGALILQTFGLNASGFWDDVYLLIGSCGLFFGTAFLWLQFMVREKR
ncbi:hypothetical protein EDD86DRAFT_191026 [Gorgonomyces haynaldii]|nr:hypothetical protein EDD86DRAFT_191026 [Gorgonomyces haynaldii]